MSQALPVAQQTREFTVMMSGLTPTPANPGRQADVLGQQRFPGCSPCASPDGVSPRPIRRSAPTAGPPLVVVLDVVG